MYAVLDAPSSLRACLLLPTSILSVVFSCPRTVVPLGPTGLPFFRWLVHRQEERVEHTASDGDIPFQQQHFISLVVRNVFLHASCSLRAYLWYWHGSMVYILVRARELSARGMLFLCPRLGWWWWWCGMGMEWYVGHNSCS